MALAIVPEVIVASAVDSLWRITEQYGFRSTGRPFQDGRIRADFTKRFTLFVVKHLVCSTGEPLPKVLVANTRTVIRGLVAKDVVVPHTLFNELTLVWGIVLLDHGFRGLVLPRDLDALKLECLTLLKLFGYLLPEKCELYCTALNDWRKHSLLWIAVRDYNVLERGLDIVPAPFVPAHPACLECPVLQAAQQ